MRIRKHREVTRATARVARTIHALLQPTSWYCTGDPRGRPGPDGRNCPGPNVHGRPDREPSLRHGNAIIPYIAGALALALACFSLVCILFFATAAHASVGNEYHNAQTPLDVTPADTSTPSPTVTITPSPTSTPSPTLTITPSPTVTTTPSPTLTPSPTVTSTPSPTATTKPAPSPTSTRYIFPSPTTSSTVGAKTSPTVAASPGASPTSGSTPTGTNTQGTGTNQGPGSSPSTANNSSDPSSQGANPFANVLPFVLIGLGVITLLPLLFIPARIILRKRLVPIPSPKVPPSGAAPWTRTPTSSLPIPPTIQQGYGLFYTPSSAPLAPSTNGYFGLTQSQPSIPTTPPLIPKVQSEYKEYQSGQTVSPTPPDNPFEGAHQPFDSSNSGARKRLRRNGLRTTNEQIAFPQQISGELSADMMVVSDPYLRTMLKQHSQKDQTVKQAPEELS